MLLYSTCTFDQMENEQAIEYLLKEYPEFVIKDIIPYEGFCKGRPELTDSGRKELDKTVRIWPHKMHGEGHYLALLQKGETEGESTYRGSKKKPMKSIPEELQKFFEDVTWELDINRLEQHGERVYYMPEELPELTGIRFLRTGLLLGEVKKNRFEPSQALAMCLKKEEYKHTISLPIQDERVVKYLKGETIEVDDVAEGKGFRLICVDDYPLGFGKLSNGTLKNKYLPGWRWQA